MDEFVIFKLVFSLRAIQRILIPQMKKEGMISDKFKFEDFINLKLNYNKTREHKHGKNF
jgi:hypothetical protein